jgi:peptide-N4-(N-acetyl-beta-glucosaminyl)asparagine amidase
MRTYCPAKHMWLLILAVVSVLLLFPTETVSPVAAQASLPAMNLVGNAHVIETGFQLTQPEPMQTGAGWLVDKQQVEGGFTADLQWEIVRVNRRGAEGFAFVLHNADGQPFPSILLGEGRHGLGYQGIPNSLAVEFDTTQTPPSDFGGGKGDPNDNHMSVQSRGQEPNNANTDFSLGFTTQGPPAIPLFTSGRHTARIVYTPPGENTPGNIAVFVDQQDKPVLNAHVNLAALLRLDEGKAWVGITGATGRRFQAHNINSFTFTPTVTPQ